MELPMTDEAMRFGLHSHELNFTPAPDATEIQKAHFIARRNVFFPKQKTTFGAIKEYTETGLAEANEAIAASPVGRLQVRKGGHITLDNIQTRFELALATLNGKGNNQESVKWVLQYGQDEFIKQNSEKSENLDHTARKNNFAPGSTHVADLKELVKNNSETALEVVTSHLNWKK